MYQINYVKVLVFVFKLEPAMKLVVTSFKADDSSSSTQIILG